MMLQPCIHCKKMLHEDAEFCGGDGCQSKDPFGRQARVDRALLIIVPLGVAAYLLYASF